MIKKLFKRGLSLLLALVLVATTFFIFDPDLLKIDADAYVDVESAEAGTFLADQTFYATETIYLKPGSSAFEDYENYNYSSGAVDSPVDKSGRIYFKNDDANAVYLLVNNFYKKDGTQMPAGSLTVNDVTVNDYAGLADGTDVYKNKGTFVKQVIGSGTLDYTINAGSLAGYEEGGVYIIEWLIGYVIDDGDNSATDTDSDLHYAFAYTGIYAPVLGQAGITYNAKRVPSTGSRIHQMGYTFITGAMKYGGGNAKSNFTNKEVKNVANGIDVATTRLTAPLISFSGYAPNNTSYTVPGNGIVANMHSNNNVFPATTNGGVLRNDNQVEGDTVYFQTTNWTSYGSFANPTPSGPNGGVSTGVAYILVDESRYTNYGQIPNLQVGWAQFEHDRDSGENKLEYIKGYNPTGSNEIGVSAVGIDTGSWQTDVENDGRSFVRGLYSLGGPINKANDGMAVIQFAVNNGWGNWASSATLRVRTNVGLHTTVCNQGDLRDNYNNALCSFVDYANVQRYASSYVTQFKSNYYDNVKAVGEALADPTSAANPSTINLKTYVDSCKKAIINGAAPLVYFYVPEVIYLNPIKNASGKYDFQYYVDSAKKDELTLNAVSDSKTGNIYFNSKSAVSVKSLTWAPYSGASNNPITVTVNNTKSDTGSLDASISGGTATKYETDWIVWTLTYVTASGQEMTVTAHSCLFPVPLYSSSQSSVISVTMRLRRDKNYILTTTGWLVGAHTVDYSIYVPGTGGKNADDNGTFNTDYAGGYTSNYLTDGMSAPAGGSKDSGGGGASFGSFYNTSLHGGSAWYKDDDGDWTENYPRGGYGTITIDSSRYTNMSQIPMLHVGMDINYERYDGNSTPRSMNLYADWYEPDKNPRPTTNNALSDSWNTDSVGYRDPERVLGKLTGPAITKNIEGSMLLALHAKTYLNRSNDDMYAQGSFYLNCNFVNKAPLRAAYNSAINQNLYLQKEYFTDAAWNAYSSVLTDAYKTLTNPTATQDQATINSKADALNAQIAKLSTALTSTSESYTYEYTKADGKKDEGPETERSDVLKQGTATVYHVLADINENGEIEGDVSYIYADGTLHSNAPSTEELGLEKETYFYGDTVVSGCNEYEGYNYYGYYLSTSGAKWADNPSLETVTGDVAAQGTYQSTGHNRYNLAKSPNITYTYIYSKDPSGVYMDWGESEQSFMNKQNLVNLKNVNVNTAFTGDDTYYNALSTEVAVVDTTDTDAFSFTVRSPGYNTYTPKAGSVNNLLDFSKITSWGSGRGTVTVDSANQSVTMTVNNSDGDSNNDGVDDNGSVDAYTPSDWKNRSDTIKLTPGKKYRMVYDYEVHTSGRTKLVPYWFTGTNAAMSDWGTTSGVTYGNHEAYAEGNSSGTDSFEFTMPSDRSYFFFRLGCTTPNAKVTFSKIKLYEITNSNQFAKMTDLFFENAATGLEGGKTYTVSFKSSLKYDDYRWYAMNMYGEASPEMDWAHEQGTIQMFISTTSNGDKLYNYTVPVRITTGVSGGGTIGTFELPEGCSNINLGFCITNDTAIGGWVDDIRIVEGDYVEVGAVGETYNLPTPLREGYSFDHWSEKSTPFHGILGTGNPYTYGTSSDTVLANWRINKYDITFDNEFDFDKGWDNPAAGTFVDYSKEGNYFRTQASGTDNYVLHKQYIDIVPGHTYKISYKYVNNNTDVSAGIQNHFFMYDSNKQNQSWLSDGQEGFTGQIYYYNIGASGTISYTVKVPEGKEFARFRLGTCNNSSADVTFSDIYIQDISRGTTTVVVDDTVSEPQYNNTDIHGVIREYQQVLITDQTDTPLTTMPTMTSDGYFFKGWFTEKTGGTQVTDTSGYKTHAGTNQLWSQWQVHIEYDLSEQGGAYLEGVTVPSTSDKYDVGATANVKIADTVPYKVGYNFVGWKDKFQGDTYQPGQTISVLNYSLILEPIWEAATDVSKDQDYEQITTLHPGQVYFYAYTPTTNNEYVSGYVYGTDSNLSVSLYNGNTVTAGTKYDAATTVYGVNGVKTIVSGALTKGTEYYFGVTSASGTKTEVSGEKFKVSEHVVKYTLNGGEGTPATQTVYGHYNTDIVFEEPTRTGHTFMNWSTAPDQNSGSEITQSFTNGLITSSTGFVTEKTMYAAWSANSYALGLYAYYNEATGSTTTSSHKKATDTENGGLVKISDDAKFVAERTTNVVYNQPVTVEAQPATGYSFKGWYANPTFSGETITAWGDVMYSDAKSIIEHMPANSLNLYARFDINTYVVNLYAYSNSGTNPEEYELSSLGGTVYLDNGTGAISATQRYVHGQSYTMHAVPATGYAFEGWYYGDTLLTGGAASGEADKTITLVKDANSDHACDHSYKAKFSVQKAKLTVSGNGGSPAEQEFEGYMGSTVNVTQPTRDGYTFDGWTLVDNATQGKPNGTLIDGVYTFGAGSDSATANWKVINYPITVDPAGGTATVEYKTGDVISYFTQTITQSTEFSVAYDSTVTLRAPSKTGHTFDKWVKSDTATGGDLVVTANGTTYKVGLNDAAVITATWTVNTYPLIVSAWSDSAGLEGKYSEGGNGGTVKFGEDASQKIEDVVNYGSTATIYAIPAEGYTFLGWQTVEPSTKEALELIPDASAEFVTAPMGTQGLHYYAVFGINQYTVDLKTAYNTPDAYDTFVEGTDGGTVTGSGTYSHNQTATLTATPKTGYAFKGWYDGETEVSVNPTYTVTVNKDIALTAKFTVVEYTITTTAVSNYANNQDQFNGNPDAGYFEDQNHNFKYYYGQETEIEAIANPGYEFKGWFSDFALTHEIGDNTSVLKVLVTESTTYYAKFEVIKVAVNLFAMSNSGSNLKDYAQNAAGGKVSYDNVTYDATANGESYFGGNYTIYAKAETGYTFDGWYTNAELTGEPFTGSYSNGYYSYIGTADNADGVNLYAKFSVGAYDLNVFAYSNTGIGLTTYNNNNVGGTVDVAGDFIAGDKVADSTNARVTAKVYFDKVATVIATPKKGYSFGGWYTSNNSFAETSTLVAVHDPETNSYKLETSAMGIDGLNYYAKFEVGSFNIVYNANGGSDLTTDAGTAYYNTAFNITQETPTKVGHIFLGWSVGNAAATAPDYKAGLTLIDAATISQWYTETYNGSDVTLYAVWAVSANYIIAKAAYSPANGEYKIGTTGGTIEVIGEKDETGNVVVQAGAYVKNHLNIIPATGYSLVCWKYRYIDDGFVDGDIIKINTWGGDNVGTDFTTMPSQILYVVAFFEIRTFSAEAKAYYNTAAETDVYSYGATGGTVKRGTNGKSASNAVSENMAYGGKVLFVADPARGYSFKGWYGEPTFVNEKVTDWGTPVTTNTENYVEIQDTSAEGMETANHYYAVFTINSYKATASVRTYTVREELIYSLTEDKRPGGDPSSKGGVVGISTKPITEDEALSGAWKDDSDWLKTGVYANEIYPCIEKIYYGERVYFAAIANPGYVFGGWYDKQDAEYYGENLVEEENLSYSRIMREGDIYMEAKFVPVSFTLILDANEGVQGNPTEIIVTYGASLKIEDSSAPTKTGSTFKGWADAPDWTGAEDEEAPYQVGDTILPSTVNAWFNEIYDSQTGTVSAKTIYAVWETAYITINLDRQGATIGKNSTEITLGSSLKSLEKDELPVYEGFVFGGYWSEAGGKGTQYYRANGEATSAVWNTPSNGTIYALWTCPVLESVDYEDGKWVYNYIHREGGTMPVESATAATSVSGVTELAKNDDGLMWWTVSVSETTTEFVEKQLEETPKINLNHYTDAALSDLLMAVVETKEEDDREKLNQPQANSYVARMAKDMDLDFSAKKECEVKAPTVKLYETSSKVSKIMDETIVDAANSANGSVYGVPNSSNAASYTYAGKWSYTEQKAVDYYIYTNSSNPVIALEIGDGDVAQTVKENTSSYPTKATVTDNASSFGYVDGEYMTSAVMATDKLDKAWFTDYTTVGIGTAHDYNAKAVVYLTPKFTSSGTRNEIVYTIKASDDAAVVNEGISKAEIEAPENQSLANMQARFESYRYDTRQKGEEPVEKVDSITVCICYHNSMNGESDEGTLDASGPYMQMCLDQVNIDKYVNQLHLLRTSGGAQNHDFPTTGENVYPVDDRNYPYSETGCVLGSFMYVFDATNEPDAAALASAGTLAGYTAAKEAIILSVSKKASDVKLALENKGNILNINGNDDRLGFAQIVGWSGNFRPKTGSYVYVHLVDRWGNVFNRVWKCENVDSYASNVNGVNGTSVYNVFEDGGSNIDTVTLDGANVEFILDDTSSYENGVFTTTGNTVAIATGEANKTYNLTITDKATNTNTVEVTTDGDGVLVLNVEDACADLSAGAYTFTLNGETVNLYSGVTKLVYSASITDISQIGMETVVTVKTSPDVVKLQLVEGIATRTYNREAADSVVENEDGTLTWTMKIKPSKGTHSYDLRAKTVNGWETTEYTLTTEVVDEYVATPVALKSVYDAKVEAGEKPVIKARTQVGTQKLQLVYSSGATITYNRSDDIVISTVDDVETWVLTGSAFSKAGEYEVKVRAKYNNEWQDASAKISTVTVTEKVVDTTPVILSVEAQSASAKIYDYVTFKVVTNSNATKIRFNYPSGDTWTFAENPEYTTVNADGTKTWTVAVKFYVLGENDITFSTRNADGWVDAQTFGTIEITK